LNEEVSQLRPASGSSHVQRDDARAIATVDDSPPAYQLRSAHHIVAVGSLKKRRPAVKAALVSCCTIVESNLEKRQAPHTDRKTHRTKSTRRQQTEKRATS